jgi:hypothetical protein
MTSENVKDEHKKGPTLTVGDQHKKGPTLTVGPIGWRTVKNP